MIHTSDFEVIIGKQDASLHIGAVIGTDKVLFIKTGQGGSIYGYENKYLELAQKINSRFGCTVIVSSTTADTKHAYDNDMRAITQVLGDIPCEVFYMGISKGGLIGCWYGVDNPKIKRILTINAPLMINFHNRTLPAIKELAFDKLTMVYGSLDPSYRFVGFADRYTNVRIIEGADHQLRGFTSMYESLAIEFLLSEK